MEDILDVYQRPHDPEPPIVSSGIRTATAPALVLFGTITWLMASIAIRQGPQCEVRVEASSSESFGKGGWVRARIPGKISGVTADRPQLKKLMATIGQGDVLIIPAVDRLSRYTTD